MINEYVQENVSSNTYSDSGMHYNYDLYPKRDESLEEYFSLDLTKAIISFLNQIGSEKRARLLDIGSGVGQESAVFRSLTHNTTVISLEYSSVGAEKGKALGLDQIQGNAVELPFKNECMDVIHSKDMFVHIRNKEQFFKEMFRILNHNGHLVIYTAFTVYPEIDQTAWDFNEIAQIANDAGFTFEYSKQVNVKEDDWYYKDTKRYCLLFSKK